MVAQMDASRLLYKANAAKAGTIIQPNPNSAQPIAGNTSQVIGIFV